MSEKRVLIGRLERGSIMPFGPQNLILIHDGELGGTDPIDHLLNRHVGKRIKIVITEI